MFLKYILLSVIVLVNCVCSNAFASEGEGAIEENPEKQEMSDLIPKFQNYLWGNRNRREMPDWIPKSENELFGKRNRRAVSGCGSKYVKPSPQKSNQGKRPNLHKALEQSLAGK
ncbi:uncharacterized protein LOC123290530 [Chrysoperla carnea]|uniref:uncharacterized protein LOC123290530 n=1 Tax=Chrysoperla carnea TaxID=189513 RepID=UPI001D06AFD1|nr:uncharacterized protein LOC123290530 [Chrysoperla carnea]